MNRKILKRFGAAVTAAIMLASFAGCAKNDTNDTAETSAVKAAVVHDEIRDIPSTELVKEIKIGWSLGNTLDSTASGIGAETAWGNIKTTKEMITAVKDAGFNGIRVPVTWGTHMDAENMVDEEWMNRVQEVVDYAYSQDMYVIINTHHEMGWLRTWWANAYGEQNTAKLEKMLDRFGTIWTQISKTFASYGERLVFEGYNETRSGESNWTSDSLSRQWLGKIGQRFVDSVRATGGNNAKDTCF